MNNKSFYIKQAAAAPSLDPRLHERIGVDCEHSGWGKDARISLLQLAVATAVFVIDVTFLQGAANNRIT